MNAKVVLLSVCLGTCSQPAQMFTDQPAQIVSQLLAAGEKVSNVIIKNV